MMIKKQSRRLEIHQRIVVSVLIVLFLLGFAFSFAKASGVDSDGDGIPDNLDNCRDVSNSDQRDTNSGEDDNTSKTGVQHYGNICDPDFDNDGIVSIIDFNEWRMYVGQSVPPAPEDIDLDGDGIIWIQDYNIWRQYYNSAPGPGIGDGSSPTATTDSATDINGNAATLNATVNPNGAETTVYFEWGTDTSYGNSTSPQSIGSGTGDVSVSANINRLSTNTTYHYRVVATNAYGTTYGDDMSFTTTGGKYVSGIISIDTLWRFADSPYIVTDTIKFYSTTSEPTLTIEPGVEVRFDGGYYLQIGSISGKGILNAQGTSAKPIIFTSNKTPPGAGDWGGLKFYNHASAKSILEYVTVEYGGFNSNCNICLYSNSPTIKNSTIRYHSNVGIYISDDSSPTITDSIISDNGTYGVEVGGTGSLSITGSAISNNGTYGIYYAGASSATISNTSFTNNSSYPISIKPDATMEGTGNTFSGNGTDSIELRWGTISTDTTWTYQGVPYIVTGSIKVYSATSEPTLTIEPGVEVRFEEGNYLEIGVPSYKGILNAQGTSAKPIIFTSNKTPPGAGDWGGLKIYNHASAKESILEYVTVEYGSGIHIDNSSPTIKNSTIKYNKDNGIYISSDFISGDSSPTITDSVISDNGASGIYVIAKGSINITFSTIKNNTNYAVYSTASILKINHCNITGNGNGIYSSTGKIADARFNWWGDATGPSGQGPGAGQSVSPGVNFEPWLGTAYTYPFYNTDLYASLQEFSPLNNSVDYTFSILEASDWTFSIKDSGGTPVKTYTGSGTSGTVTWDGKDESSVIVPDGTYTYQLSSTSINGGSQSAPFIGDIVIGQGLPKAEITYPVDGQFIGNTLLDILGTAKDDSDFDYYDVEYGLGTAPTSWTPIQVQGSTTPVDAGILATWDPSNLTEAYYSIRLSVNDTARNTATDSVEIRLLNINNISVSNPYFSPDGDGSKDTTTITASITYSSDWAVDIKNSGSTVVRTLTGTGDSISATWDGKDTYGVVQPEGTYTFTITATEPGSGVVATMDSTTDIILDLTQPVAQISLPAANQEVYETVTITGTASDAVTKDYHRLYYGAGTNPSSYTLMNPGAVNPGDNITNGTLGTWCTHGVVCSTIPNGIYTLKLSVVDKAGNSAETTVPVTVSNATVSNFTTSASFEPSSNQPSTISYTLAKGGFITIKIGDYTGFFRVLIENAKRPAGQNIDYWDGRDDDGDLVETGRYKIAIWTATDPDPMPVTAPRITDPLATPVRFDPTTDTGATISYNLDKDATVTVSIYDWNDNLIKNVVTDDSQPQGTNSVVWDGKNESGNYVYPGAYRFKIVATDSDGVTGPEVTGVTQVYY